MNNGNNSNPKQQSKKSLNNTMEVTESVGLLTFLIKNISGKSRNNIKSLLAHREVTVDGIVQTKFDFNLRTGQKVNINNPAARAQKYEKEPEIIYEDADIIVINKPAGLVAVATTEEKENTAYSILTDYIRRKNPDNRIFIVHRLDRDTSGVLLAAKNEKMKLALQDNWSEIVTDRRYVAIVEGRLENKSGKIKSWLRQTKTLLMYSSDTAGDGLEAVTNYKVLKENNYYSMVDIHLETGRKNQIRVHMKDLGHSVAGDKKYGAETNPLKRLGLHACKLELKNPVTGKLMTFESPIPASFNAMFKKTL
jgi:23S rRNA pseudouridine1911/1915/1917 synthase